MSDLMTWLMASTWLLMLWGVLFVQIILIREYERRVAEEAYFDLGNRKHNRRVLRQLYLVKIALTLAMLAMVAWTEYGYR